MCGNDKVQCSTPEEADSSPSIPDSPVRVSPDNTPPEQWTESYCIIQTDPDEKGFRHLRLGIFSFSYGRENVLGHFRLRFDKATGKLLALEDFSQGYGHLEK